MNTGICNVLEAYLKTHGEKRHSELCTALPQYSPSNISGALSTLKRENKVVSGGRKKNATYKIKVWTAESPTGIQKYVPIFKPLKGRNAFSNWELCLRAPYDAERDAMRLVR